MYTKTGDKGMTSLIGGTRVAKNNVRLDAYGGVDELNSHIGMIRSYPIAEEAARQLVEIQNVLFVVGALAASRAEILLNRQDPGCVVIDELVGQWISMLCLGSFSLSSTGKDILFLMVPFLFFRFFGGHLLLVDELSAKRTAKIFGKHLFDSRQQLFILFKKASFRGVDPELEANRFAGDHFYVFRPNTRRRSSMIPIQIFQNFLPDDLRIGYHFFDLQLRT